MTSTSSGPELPGAARLVPVEGLGLLQPESAVMEAMPEGWARQQRVRFLKTATIAHRLRMARRMVEFSNLYPWQRTAVEIEGFIGNT
ncbi:hypothetical protein [Oerskovia enterophila]|uniref:hypothetical protein n=1 Tax=Oerskovia enterophila TaxID=43678 RepID=UPI00382A1DAD